MPTLTMPIQEKIRQVYNFDSFYDWQLVGVNLILLHSACFAAFKH